MEITQCQCYALCKNFWCKTVDIWKTLCDIQTHQNESRSNANNTSPPTVLT